MYKSSIFLIVIIMGAVAGMISFAAKNNDAIPMHVWMGCDGNEVTRTEVGKIVITHIAKNSIENDISVDTGTISSNTTGSLNMFDDGVV